MSTPADELRRYYDASYPPSLFLPRATGATAGIPGTWTPAQSQHPANAAQATQWGVVASPLTAWTTGQHVQGSLPGAPGEMTWTGSAWVGGRAPLADPTSDPGSFTIGEIQTWVDGHDDQADEVLAAEQARNSPRVTLVDWLVGFIAARDEPP